MHALIESNRAEIRALAERYGLRDVRIFGSVARVDADEASDVDLLVTLPAGCSDLAPGAFLMDAQNLLDRHVQVVTERSLHAALREQVFGEAPIL